MVCGVCGYSVSEDFIIEVRSKVLVYDVPMVRVCGVTCLRAYWRETLQARRDFTGELISDAPAQG